MLFWLILVVHLVVKKRPELGFCITKTFLTTAARIRFMTFSEYEWRTRSNSQMVDRCTGSCLACRQTHTNYFETGEILSSCWIIQPNASKVSIRVILAAKARFLTTTNWKKVSINTGDTEGQPEAAIWPPKPEEPEALYFRNYDRYHQTSNGTSGVFDHAELEQTVPGDCDNDRQLKWQNRRFGANLAILGGPTLSQSLCCIFTELAKVNNPEFPLEFRPYLS